MQHDDDHEGEHETYDARRPVVEHGARRRFERPPDGRFGHGAQPERRHGHADLHPGDVARQRRRGLERGRRAEATLGRQLLEPAATAGHQRELERHEEGVDEQQGDDGDDDHHEAAGGCTSSRAMRRRSISTTRSVHPSHVHSSPSSGTTLELHEREAGERVVGAVGQEQAARLGDLAQVEAAVEHVRAARGHDGELGVVVLVVDGAHQLLEHVLQRHDAGGAAVLVDHHGELQALAAQEHEQVAEQERLGHGRGGVDELGQFGRGPVGVGDAEQVLGQHHPDHVVAVLAPAAGSASNRARARPPPAR